MRCPLYLASASGNPLRVCGPKERLGYAPSSAHLRLFCLSTSAYNECPMYKLRATKYEKPNQWVRFFKQIFGGFYLAFHL